MPATSVEVLGTVRPDGTLELNEKLDVPPGQVRVRVETVVPAAPSTAEGLVEFVDRMRQEREAAGHRFRTKEEIDAEIEALRNEWDEREEDRDRARVQPDA
jgi:hypothetical protein